MGAGLSFHDPILVNTIGHSAGVLLFGLIIILLLKDWHRHGVRQTRLSLLAASLAFFWNLSSLILLGTSQGRIGPSAVLVIASFAVLTLLPAVLLQVVLRGRFPTLTVIGYLVCSVAVCLQISELYAGNSGAWQLALLLIVIGFSGVTLAAAFAVWRKASRSIQQNASGLLSLACLFLFTLSFLHFGYEHSASAWSDEVAWHHASIPLALVVLLQDYRFLLLDTFARFLLNFGLAACFTALLVAANEKFDLAVRLAGHDYVAGLGIVLCCLSLIAFAYLRALSQQLLTKRIFRRRDLALSLRKLYRLTASARNEDELIEAAAAEAAYYSDTPDYRLLPGVVAQGDSPGEVMLLAGEDLRKLPREVAWGEVKLILRFSSGDTRSIILGARRGGRRYLSEDINSLRRIASVMVEQVERFRSEELRRLVDQAELRALQAQINPHFLFNALNTLYGTIDRRSSEARKLVLNLSEIFRYFLRSDRAFIPLSEELHIIEAYLEIEALRLGDRLQTEIVVSEAARRAMIPVLSIEPIVENAVKHGIATKQERGKVSLHVEKRDAGLWIEVQDTGPGFEARAEKAGSGNGIGLDNVRQRLKLCYGPAAELQIESNADGTRVSFLVPSLAPSLQAEVVK